MPATYSEIEIRFIRTLAEWYGNPRDGTCTTEALAATLGVSLDECYRLIETARGLRLIKEPPTLSCGRVVAFTPTRSAVDAIAGIDADLEASKRPDRVEVANNWIRRNPLTAWGLIGFVVAVAILQSINNVLDICIKLGWLPKR